MIDLRKSGPTFMSLSKRTRVSCRAYGSMLFNVFTLGLGPISAPDNVAPGAAAVDMTNVPVTITVGGVTAQRLYAGRQSQSAAVDNIYFTVPAGVAFGCQVPVDIVAGGVPANTTTIAVTADGSPCQ